MPEHKKGVTLTEIMVAIAILAIGLGAAMHVFFSIFGAQRKSTMRLQAVNLARSLLDGCINPIQLKFIYKNTNNPPRWCYYTNASSANNYYLVSNDFSPQWYTSYTSFPANYPRSGDNYYKYYYRVDIRPVSDPNMLFVDNLCYRVTVYVTVPPINPTVRGWGLFSHSCASPYPDCRTCEMNAINRGYVIVLSSFTTKRENYTNLVDPLPTVAGYQRYPIGAVMLLVQNSGIFAAFNTGNDGVASPDQDYSDSYSLPLTGTYQSTFSSHADINDKANYNAIIAPRNATPVINILYSTAETAPATPTTAWNNEAELATMQSYYNPDLNAVTDRFALTAQTAPFSTNDTVWNTGYKAPDAPGGQDGIMPYYERNWWEKVQVTGTSPVTIGGQQYAALQIKNIRGDAVRNNAQGIYFPYQCNQTVRAYIFLRLNYP